jgi:hypothetical protein
MPSSIVSKVRPSKQVGRVDGVAGPAQLVGERPHSSRQSLDVVVEQNVCHATS